MTTRTGASRKIAIVAAGLAVVALAFATLPAAAQMRGALRGKRTLKAAMAGETTPLQVLADLLGRLQLTDEQKTAIRGIIGAHKTELLAIAGAEQTSRAALREAIRQGAFDQAAVTAAAAVVARADVQLSLERAALFSEIWAVLTDAQRQELAGFAADVKAKVLERLANLGGADGDLAKLFARGGNRLGLSPDQKDEIKRILANHKSELAAAITGEVVARTALNAALHQPAVNETAVRRACVAVAAADLQLDLERARIFSEVWAVLTIEQQDQLTTMLAAIEARVEARVEALLAIFKAVF